MNTTNVMPFALCAYSLPHVMGYLRTQAGEKIAEPLGAAGLIQSSADFGLAGVELPISAWVKLLRRDGLSAARRQQIIARRRRRQKRGKT